MSVVLSMSVYLLTCTTTVYLKSILKTYQSSNCVDCIEIILNVNKLKTLPSLAVFIIRKHNLGRKKQFYSFPVNCKVNKNS